MLFRSVIAKGDVVALLKEFISSGGTCIIATNDPEEFLHIANRVIIMRKGSIVGDFSSNEINEEKIIKTMLMHDSASE